MIVFDLKCGRAHVFEAWFGSSADYEDQRGRGLIGCPLCGDAEVAKAAMAPAVPAKGNRALARPVEAEAPSTPEPTDTTKQKLAMLLAAQRAMEAESDYVGRRFVSEARAIHDGAAEKRSIYGEASLGDAAALAADGIAVAPLPFRPRVLDDA